MHYKFDEQLNETKNILESVNTNIAIEYAIWTKDKAKMKFYKNLPTFPITNNFIYWCNLGVNVGSEQNKTRPAIIIRTQTNSPTCTILPLTSSRLHDSRWYHIDLEEYNSTAMIEQVRNVSKLRILNPKRICGKLCKITHNDLLCINKVLEKYYKLQDFPKNM